MTGPSVSLITVTYNSETDLTECWRDFDPSWAEWLVADNGSSDGSASVASALGATVIPMAGNVGFSKANNCAANEASGDVLIFCNPDVTVDGPGIRRLAQFAVDCSAIVAPQLVNRDGSLQENGRGAPYPHRKLAHMLGRHAGESRYTRLAGPGELRRVVWVMGAAIAMSKQVFDQIGGWNDSFFIYYEDAEISLRALREGVATYVDGGVTWRHGWARETARGFSAAAWKHEVCSGLRFYRTHPECLVPLGSSGRLVRQTDGADRRVP